MNCEVTYQDGRAEQENFYAHEGMRLYQCPQIEVRGLEVSDTIAGIGEPPVPPAAPALANAIFAATGQRLRAAGLNASQLARIHGPIGLIPAQREPRGLAVSILADVAASFACI